MSTTAHSILQFLPQAPTQIENSRICILKVSMSLTWDSFYKVWRLFFVWILTCLFLLGEPRASIQCNSKCAQRNAGGRVVVDRYDVITLHSILQQPVYVDAKRQESKQADATLSISWFSHQIRLLPEKQFRITNTTLTNVYKCIHSCK